MNPSQMSPLPSQARWSWRVHGRRLTLVRRLAHHFEVRRTPGARTVEMRVFTGGRIYRWVLPAALLQGVPPSEARIAVELDPVEPGERDAFVSPWDEGRWEISESRCTAEQFRTLHARGEFSLLLLGRRVAGELRFQRTPMAVEGRPRWYVRRVRPAPRPARERS